MIRSQYLSTLAIAALIGAAPAFAQTSPSSTMNEPTAATQKADGKTSAKSKSGMQAQNAGTTSAAKPLCSDLHHPNAGKLADKATGKAKDKSNSPVHQDCVADSQATASPGTAMTGSSSSGSTSGNAMTGSSPDTASSTNAPSSNSAATASSSPSVSGSSASGTSSVTGSSSDVNSSVTGSTSTFTPSIDVRGRSSLTIDNNTTTGDQSLSSNTATTTGDQSLSSSTSASTGDQSLSSSNRASTGTSAEAAPATSTDTEKRKKGDPK